MVHQVMSFFDKSTFCVNGHAQCFKLYHVLQSDMLNVYHSPVHFFLSFHLTLPVQCQPLKRSHLQQSPTAFQFHLSDVVISTDAMLYHWAFYCQGCGLPVLSCGTWSGSMYKMHIALQELQAVALMFCKMAFRFSGKVVILHLNNSAAKAYLFNQGGFFPD